jgi:DNA-binding response OmpR family regulator
MEGIRTLVVDDNAGFRRHIKEFLAFEPELKPDLVLMDVRMPGTNGIEATRQLKDEMPELKVIMLSLFDLQEYREAAMASGASEYVVKNCLIEELLPAIRGTFGCAGRTLRGCGARSETFAHRGEMNPGLRCYRPGKTTHQGALNAD